MIMVLTAIIMIIISVTVIFLLKSQKKSKWLVADIMPELSVASQVGLSAHLDCNPPYPHRPPAWEHPTTCPVATIPLEKTSFGVTPGGRGGKEALDTMG